MTTAWTFRRVHTWLGIAGALFWIVVGSTGTLLTFRTSLRKPVPDPPAMAQGVELASVAYIEADVLARFEEPRVNRIHFATRDDPLWRVVLNRPANTTVYYSGVGEHLATVVDERWFTKLLFKIHTGAIVGRLGELFSALLGVVLLVSVVTGVLIWPWLIKKKRRTS